MLAVFIVLLGVVALASSWAIWHNVTLYRAGVRAIRERRAELHESIVLRRLERSMTIEKPNGSRDR